ncbi:MAG: hypothetical protein U1F76_09790 [Candidatus Competibacteraceae bacterium]
MKDKWLTYPTVGVYGVFLLIMIISLTYGFGYRFSTNGLYYLITTVLFFITLLGITGTFLLSLGNRQEWSEKLSDFIGFLMVSLSLLLSTFFYSKTFYPLPWIYIALPVFLAGFFLQLKWGLRVSTLFLFFTGFAFFIFLVKVVPSTVEAANMLPIIEAAAHKFLAGENPYQYYRGVSSFPFDYFPGLWLPYTLFVYLAIDLRILNLICFLSMALIFEKISKSNSASGVLSFTIYPLLLSSPVAQMVIHGHIWPYWVLLLLTALFLYQKNFFVASIFFGLTLATRQPALFLVGPFLIYIYKRLGRTALIKYGILAIIVYAAMLLPFSFTAQSYDLIHWYLLRYSDININIDFNQIAGIDYLYLWHLEGLAKYIQIIILLLCIGMVYNLARSNKYKLNHVLFLTGIGYVWFIFFNSYVVRYLYFPGFLLMAFALAIWQSEATNKISQEQAIG